MNNTPAMTKPIASFRWSGDPLTIVDLDCRAAAIAQHTPVGTARFIIAIQTSVVCHFLGREWYEAHAFVTSPRRSFLHPHFGADGLAPIWSMRMLNLVEMLINLQAVEGFRTCLDHMTLDQLESALSELQIGMMLHQDHIAFRYIDPTTVMGKSPDIEIALTCGATAFADIKCKYEATDVSEETVRNTLKKGGSQLPKGKPGLLFIKVPQGWTFEARETVMLPMVVFNATTAFLRNTSRVVKVVYYMFHLTRSTEGMLNRHAIREINNPHNPADSPWTDHLFPSARNATNWVTLPWLLERWSSQEGPESS
jgi:hypothetical protein